MAAFRLHRDGTECPELSPVDTRLHTIVRAWDSIPENLKVAIMAIVASDVEVS